jgi:uncharacterized protein (TIGR02270 family)
MKDTEALIPHNAQRLGTGLLAENRNDLATYYLDRLALAWRRRSKQITAYHHDFSDLLDWDRRIQAYLQALTLLEPQACAQGLERLKAPLLNEELFALILLALKTRNPHLTQAGISLVQGMPSFIAPYAEALAWVSWRDCEVHLSCWPNRDERYQQLYLHALAHHDGVLTERQLDCVSDPSFAQPQVQLAALRCAVLRGEAFWASQAKHWIDAPDPRLRLAATEALMTLGIPKIQRATLPILRDLALDTNNQTVARNAARKLLTIPCNEGQELIEALEIEPRRQRLYLEALGWTGELAAIPRLHEYLDDPQNARLAAAVIGTLIGAHPVRDRWQAEAPPQTDPPRDASEKEDALPPPDPDAGLPWPDRARFSNWWRDHQDNWPNGFHYLGGRPRTGAGLYDVLRTGILAWRPQAAEYLQFTQPGRRFPWHAPAPRQQCHLALFAESRHG